MNSADAYPYERMARIIFASGLLVALVACDDRVERPIEDLPYPQAELARFQTVVDTLFKRCQHLDSLACDTLIGELEDPRLAHTRPALIADGYWSYVASHAWSNPVPLARMDAFARQTQSEGLRNWVLLLRGKQALEFLRVDTALSLCTQALPGFLEMADTFGIMTCTFDIGTIHLYRLDQPREFLRFWPTRERFTVDTFDLFTNAAHSGTAYRNLGLTDSARLQLAIMDRLRPTVDRFAPRNLSNKVYHDDLLFTIRCTEASRTKQVDMDELHKLFADEVTLVESNYLKYGWNPITVRIDYANALIANGRDTEALTVLKEGEHILANCARCKYHAIEFYQLLVSILKARKDLAGAFHYQELHMRAKEELDMQERRAKTDQALINLRFEHQRDSLVMVNEREQAAAEKATARSRSQRNLLLIGAVLGLVIVVLLWNHYRQRRTIEMERMRTRLSRDLHDDIGSTLSSISILSSVARKKAEADHDPEAAASLAKISDRSQRLMRNMSDIVWSVDPKNDSIEDLLARMREFSTSLFELKGIAHTFDQPAVIPAISLSAETKNNIYLLFKEAVNNVAKHSQCTHVRVSTALEQNMLHLVVKDDGLGMDLGARTNGHGGNGLRNMRERAAEMRAVLHLVSDPGNGTTITLDVPLRG